MSPSFLTSRPETHPDTHPGTHAGTHRASSPEAFAEARTVRLDIRRGGPGAPVTPGPLAEAARWGALALPVGRFSLHEIHTKRDLPLLHTWMNDPDVARWWHLAGDEEVVRRHLAEQAARSHTHAYLGCLDDEPIGYWELYRADLDDLARHYPAHPHDVGVHVLIGPPARRGRGVGAALLRAVAELVLRAAPDTGRVIAEPDRRNTASVAAFERAGFTRAGDVELPDKSAALMIRARSVPAAGTRS